VLSDPQVLAREMIKAIEGPQAEKIKRIGHPLNMEKTPVETFLRPPFLGKHTRDVLTNVFGYPEEKVISLKEQGALKIGGAL